MNKLKQCWSIILLVVIILGGLFYWYEYRPARIRKNCSQVIKFKTPYSEKIITKTPSEENYKECLREHGLEK